MCKLGDIIVVKEYVGDDGTKVSQHSFVVVNDKPDFIEGVGYDFIANVMSSFKSEEQRMKKLRFEENVEIISDEVIGKLPLNKKSGFIKADQLFYFDKKRIEYYVLGKISEDLLDELLMVIVSLNEKGKLKSNYANIVTDVEQPT